MDEQEQRAQQDLLTSIAVMEKNIATACTHGSWAVVDRAAFEIVLNAAREAFNVKHRLSIVDEHMKAVLDVAAHYGWNGVDNSKFVWDFFDELITRLKSDEKFMDMLDTFNGTMRISSRSNFPSDVTVHFYNEAGDLRFKLVHQKSFRMAMHQYRKFLKSEKVSRSYAKVPHKQEVLEPEPVNEPQDTVPSSGAQDPLPDKLTNEDCIKLIATDLSKMHNWSESTQKFFTGLMAGLLEDRKRLDALDDIVIENNIELFTNTDGELTITVLIRDAPKKIVMTNCTSVRTALDLISNGLKLGTGAH